MTLVAVLLGATRISEINLIIQRFSVRLKLVPEVDPGNISPINKSSNQYARSITNRVLCQLS
jgi:hypothetical protein